jgi:hypothetical protein
MTKTVEINKVHAKAIHKYVVVTIRMAGETGVSYFPTLLEAEDWAKRAKSTYGESAVVDIAKIVSVARLDIKY